MSRSSFLKDAVSRAYESRLSKGESPAKRAGSPPTTSDAFFPAAPHRRGRLSDQSDPNKLANDFRERRAALAEELQQKNNEAPPKEQIPQVKIGFRRSTFVDERPLSKYHEVMKRFEPPGSNVPPGVHVPSSSNVPPVPSIQPQYEPPVSSRLGQSVMTMMPPSSPQVRDPVDMAMARMVDDLGFNREDAKRALKATDTGDAINVDAAVMLLVQERRKEDPALQQLEQELGVDMNSMNTFTDDALIKIKNSPGWRWA